MTRDQTPIQRRVLLFWMLALTTAASLGLQFIRQEWTKEGRFWNIAWDLFLAWVPLAAAVWLEWHHRSHRQRNWLLLGALGILWLLFFPNAPYLVTEFVHLGAPEESDPIWWCDLVVILLIAWNGVLLGFASLYLVQLVVREHLGQAGSWLVAAGCLALASLGISIGRFERLNSWDTLVNLCARSSVASADSKIPTHSGTTWDWRYCSGECCCWNT